MIIATVVFFLLQSTGAPVFAATDSLIHYDDVMAQLDRQRHAELEYASTFPDSLLSRERLANAYLTRAKLSGSFEDYLAAQQSLQNAFGLTGDQTGPVMARARLNFSLHRLSQIEPDLVVAESALLIDAPTIASIAGMRADVLFYSGQYASAKAAFDELESSDPTVPNAVRLAHYYASTGDYEEAESWYRQAENRVTGSSPQLRSWLKLQLGILDLNRGRWADALEHYEHGLHLFPGYWLLEEHIAEIYALQGRDEVAEVLYRDLILRTQSPLFMAALADILSGRNNAEDQLESARLLKRTTEIYEVWLKEMPEMTSGHAIDYFLQSGDVEQALHLAKYNYELRPNGEAAVLLMQAHILSSQFTHARELLNTLLKSPYRSAELYATAGIIFRESGEEQKAQAYELNALAINSSAINAVDWLTR